MRAAWRAASGASTVAAYTPTRQTHMKRRNSVGATRLRTWWICSACDHGRRASSLVGASHALHVRMIAFLDQLSPLFEAWLGRQKPAHVHDAAGVYLRSSWVRMTLNSWPFGPCDALHQRTWHRTNCHQPCAIQPLQPAAWSAALTPRPTHTKHCRLSVTPCVANPPCCSPPAVQARTAAWLHARPAHQPGCSRLPLPGVPPRLQALPAHRLQRRAADQRVCAGCRVPATGQAAAPHRAPHVCQVRVLLPRQPPLLLPRSCCWGACPCSGFGCPAGTTCHCACATANFCPP